MRFLKLTVLICVLVVSCANNTDNKSITKSQVSDDTVVVSKSESKPVITEDAEMISVSTHLNEAQDLLQDTNRLNQEAKRIRNAYALEKISLLKGILELHISLVEINEVVSREIYDDFRKNYDKTSTMYARCKSYVEKKSQDYDNIHDDDKAGYITFDPVCERWLSEDSIDLSGKSHSEILEFADIEIAHVKEFQHFIENEIKTRWYLIRTIRAFLHRVSLYAITADEKRQLTMFVSLLADEENEPSLTNEEIAKMIQYAIRLMKPGLDRLLKNSI